VREDTVPDLIGKTVLGRYHIEVLIGRGGIAEVYKAWDTRRQYYVAIKVMREDLAEDIEFLRRLKQEAQALAALSYCSIRISFFVTSIADNVWPSRVKNKLSVPVRLI
jgi:serine/threonine protein kinase